MSHLHFWRASPLRSVCRRTIRRLYPPNLGCTALATGDFRMTRAQEEGDV